MNEREKLITELNRKCSTYVWDGQQNRQILDDKQVAEFILADRKRIVQPLMEYKAFAGDKLWAEFEQKRWPAMAAMVDTLKNAGLGTT